MVRQGEDPWRADVMEDLAYRLRWNAKDARTAPKPVGIFDDDYTALCRIFQVPKHPCLVSRRSTNVSNDGTTPSEASSSKQPILQFQNFVVDLTTLRIMMEALRRSKDIDTLNFHNAGLSDTAVGVLAEELPQTRIRCLRLDYNNNNNSPPLIMMPSSSSTGRKASSRLPDAAAEPSGGKKETGVSAPSSSTRIDFTGLVREGSRLEELLLRGNGIDDAEAVALAEAIEGNIVLCSLNMFNNKITDVGAAALAETLRLNTSLRSLSLARNHLTSVSAKTFGLLLAGGYEVLPAELEKRAVVEAKIATHNKAVVQGTAKKKKKGAGAVETTKRLPLSAVAPDADGRNIAGGSRSLAALNLSENRELGKEGALVELFARIAEARKKMRGADEGLAEKSGKLPGGEVAVPLQELHVAGCQGYRYLKEQKEETDSLVAAALALQPTRVTF